jgi:hypothetical protein
LIARRHKPEEKGLVLSVMRKVAATACVSAVSRRHLPSND